MKEKMKWNDYDSLPLILDVTDIQHIMGISRASAYELFHTKIGVKLCSMAGGGVSRNLWNFFRTAPAGTGQAVTCSTSGMGLRLK